ncbi:hypothetical protein [Bacillus anthracis]
MKAFGVRFYRVRVFRLFKVVVFAYLDFWLFQVYLLVVGYVMY